MSAILAESDKVNTKNLGIQYQMRIIDVPNGEQDIFGRKKTERTGNLIFPEESFKSM